MDELERRLRGRHTEDEDEIERRLETARAEMARQDEFDLRVVNDDAERAAAEIDAYVASL
jgi:guanylate kinase